MVTQVNDPVFGSATRIEATDYVVNQGCAAGAKFLLEMWICLENPDGANVIIALSTAWWLVAESGVVAFNWLAPPAAPVPSMLDFRDQRSGPEETVSVPGGRLATSSAVLRAGDWAHLAVTYDGTKLTLLVNGLEAASDPNTTGLAAFENWEFGGSRMKVCWAPLHRDVKTAAASPDGSCFALAKKNSQAIWICDSQGAVLRTLGSPENTDPRAGHTSPPEFLVWSPDGKRLYSAGRDPIVRAWDTESGKCVWSHDTRRIPECVPHIALNADGHWLATRARDQSQSHDAIRVLDASTGVVKFDWVDPSYDSKNATGLWFGPDNTVYTNHSSWRCYQYWEPTAQPNRYAVGMKGSFAVGKRRLVYSRTERSILAKVIRDAFGDNEFQLDFGPITFSRDESHFLAGSGTQPNSFDLWQVTETAFPNNLCNFSGHAGRITALGYTKDTVIVSGGADKTVRIWDAGTRAALDVFFVSSPAKAVLPVLNVAVLCDDGNLWINGSTKHFQGRIAKQRLVTPPPEPGSGTTVASSIRAKLESDILRKATGGVFPLEFSLLNDDQQPVLFMDGEHKALTLEIKNVGIRSVHLPGGAGDGCVELRFRPGTLVQAKDVKLDKTASLTYTLTHLPDTPDGMDCYQIRLRDEVARTPQETLLPGAARQIRMEGLCANQLGDERTTRVQLRYRLQFDEFSPIEGSRVHNLSIQKRNIGEIEKSLSTLSVTSAKLTDLATIRDAVTELQKAVNGLKAAGVATIQSLGVAISAGIHGVPAILCDRDTKNTFTLRLSNHTNHPIELGDGIPKRATGINADLPDPPAYFHISWDAADERPWGLTAERRLGDINIEVSPDTHWKIDIDPGKRWVKIQNKDLTELEVFRAAAKNYFVEVTFKQVVCDADPGLAWLYVDYGNMGPLVKADDHRQSRSSGHLQVAIERTPCLPRPREVGVNVTTLDGRLELANSGGNPELRFQKGPKQASVSFDGDRLSLGDKDRGVQIANLQLVGDVEANTHSITGLKEVTAGRITAKQGVHYDYLAENKGDPGNLVPRGAIMMWSPNWLPNGRQTEPPKGWVICDGESYDEDGVNIKKSKKPAVVKTPDLSRRFIMGAGSGSDEADRGDKADTHTHTVWTKEIVDLPTSADGKHNHGWPDGWYARGLDDGKYSGIDTRNQVDRSTNVSGEHHHKMTIPSLSGGTDSVAAGRPAWYALNFIMKL